MSNTGDLDLCMVMTLDANGREWYYTGDLSHMWCRTRSNGERLPRVRALQLRVDLVMLNSKEKGVMDYYVIPATERKTTEQV